MAYTLRQLAALVGGEVAGDDTCVIARVAPVQDSAPDAISFVSSAKYAKFLAETRAGAVIVTAELVASVKTPALIVKNPRAAHARITAALYPAYTPPSGVHPSAVIAVSARIAASASIAANAVVDEGAVIDEGACIGAGCVIGRNSVIGKQVRLYPNVTVYHDCSIGDGSIIHSSTVIGADGFGFEFDQGEWLKIPQVGGVRIGRNVEIGACSTVDRGALNDTVIEDGVKLDNHVQIAHNVQVGAHTIMSNGVGVAGSTRIGRHCVFGGMTGVRDNIEIADHVMVNAMSMVSKSLDKAGSYSSGLPVDETAQWRKNTARFRQLDELARRLAQLEKKIKE